MEQRTASAVKSVITKHIMPDEEVASSQAKDHFTETSRMDIDRTDICPICNKQMRILNVNGHLANVCMDDSVILPIQDEV